MEELRNDDKLQIKNVCTSKIHNYVLINLLSTFECYVLNIIIIFHYSQGKMGICALTEKREKSPLLVSILQLKLIPTTVSRYLSHS